MAASVVAKIVKKGKVKHEYPWPDEMEPDPNVKGGILSYLSEFKPLKEKPKPVTLPFEKPLMDLEKKIMDVQKMAAETGLDFTDQIISLESKYEQALKDLYIHLTPIQRVSIARHPNRPTFLDHIFNITEKFVELHGDRAGYDDPAIVTGIGSIEGRSYMFIGHQKGRNTKENIKRNFGMPTPHGYRKALRMMYYADHHGLPIITFIDTPGAFADLKSEELGQGEAIAFNLRTMFGLKVPVVTIVIGEGGSGGALAIGCANKLLMMENAVFYVASPEACAAILWKTAKASPKAAEKLKITATELCKLKIADGVIPEPLGGAHADPSWTSQQIKLAVVEAMKELLEMDTEKLLQHRALKFRNLGGFIEGQPIDPVKKINMKKKDEPIIDLEELSATSALDLEQEIEKLKEQIQKSEGKSSSEPVTVSVSELVAKLKDEVDQELSDAAEFMGLTEKLDTLRSEITKTGSSEEQPMDPILQDKIEKLKQEFQEGLKNYPNSGSLNQKLNMLNELSKAQKIAPLKQEINEGFKEVMNRPDLKLKVDLVKEELSKAGVSKTSDLDDSLKEKILEVKKEIASELTKTLKSKNLDVEPVTSTPVYAELKERADELNVEVKERIREAVNSSDLKSQIEALKLEVEKAGETPDPETKSRILEMKEKIKNTLAKVVDSPDLKMKYETLKEGFTRVHSENAPEELSSGLNNGGLNHGATTDNESEVSRANV